MKSNKQNLRGNTVNGDSSPYLSPRDLAERWRCSRTSVHRIAKQANFRRVILGNGKHCGVRYVRVDVEEYEQTRQV